MKTQQKWWFSLACLLVVALVLAACGGSETAEPAAAEPTAEAAMPAEETVAEEPVVEEPAAEAPESSDEMGTVELSMWYHGAGNETESAIVRQIIDDFNASQSEYVIALEDFPQDSYNQSVVAGALAGNLPDIIDMDGPVMPNWAWAGYLSPWNYLRGQLTASYLAPSACGTAKSTPSVSGMLLSPFMPVALC
jgi:ABC-type glycerol-3-phosphate transport system substrate-binding protein